LEKKNTYESHVNKNTSINFVYIEILFVLWHAQIVEPAGYPVVIKTAGVIRTVRRDGLNENNIILSKAVCL